MVGGGGWGVGGGWCCGGWKGGRGAGRRVWGGVGGEGGRKGGGVCALCWVQGLVSISVWVVWRTGGPLLELSHPADVM